jgi:hypothetical protein
MPNNHSPSRPNNGLLPFLKSVGFVLAFSPWLVVAYALVTSHALTLRQNDQDAIRGFIEWFGTAYSFFLGLALVNVWSQFETVDREFDRELDALSSLHQTVDYTSVEAAPPDPVKRTKLATFKRTVRREIRDYVQHVIANHRFEHRVHEQQRRGDRILETIGGQISTLTREKVVPETFLEELFKSLNEALDARGDRISRSDNYTPVVVKVMAVATSVIWLFSFLGLAIYDKTFAIALVGGAAFVIIMVLVIFFDLGEPFGGIWKIHLDDWPKFLETIDHDQDPQVIFIYKLEKSALNVFNRRGKCRLYELAQGDRWEPFLGNLERDRGRRHPRLTSQAFHCNQLQEQGLPTASQAWPLVVLKRASSTEVVLDGPQIEACPDMPAFETRFHAEMRNHLRWYTP